MRTKSRRSNRRLAAAASLATGLMTTGFVSAADTGSYVTISISGSTAMRNFTISEGFSALEAGAANLTLSNGIYAPGAGGLQLAPLTNTGAILAGSSGTGIRIEWHEQGSVEGIVELVNDQIGYGAIVSGSFVGSPLVSGTTRNPSSGNPIRLNRNNATTAGAPGGWTISGNQTYDTYDADNYHQTFGGNILGGQNRVQWAISDVNAAQGFSKTGTGAFSLTPGSAGYGKGNALLSSGNVSGLGTSGSRQQLVDEDALNMKTDRPNPHSTIGAGDGPTNHNTYGAGSWNTNGTGNLVNKTVAITATVIAANPGTGLTQINKGDAQWLQLTGRLQNGVDFNVTERDVNSGTRNVVALNTGVDPSWTVGDNDGGDGGATATAGSEQSSIGANMKFSGKTAGGAQLRPTVQNNRMAIGQLGLSDARSGNAAVNNASNFPVRALRYSDTLTDTGANFVQVSASTITDGTYKIWQNQTYVTVRNPNATDYNNDNIAKGDPNGDMIKIRNNILSSVTSFPNPTSAFNAADSLITNSFVLPQMMIVSKTVDGGSYTVEPGPMRAALLADSTASGRFTVNNPINQTAGNNSNYGVAPLASGNSILGVGVVNIPITAQNAAGALDGSAGAVGGNYLFGNFNQNGVRDFDAIKKARDAQERLFTAGGAVAAAVDATDAAISNSTKYGGYSATLMNMNASTGPSKGDVIVMGDYNGDGRFNGRDLYYMARGAAVSDASGSGFTNGTLTATNLTFGDKIRSAKLRKNDALDWMDANTTAQQKIDASANLINDPTGANAFNKFDVNRDGLVTRSDAQVVDNFVNKSYLSLTNQLEAVIASNGTLLDGVSAAGLDVAETAAPISLVDVELDDSNDGGITHIDPDGAGPLTSDFQKIRSELTSTSLLDGDVNFDGFVNVLDMYVLATHWLSPADQWSDADFNFDGMVDATDLGLLGLNWLGEAAQLGQAVEFFGLPSSAVPEPGCLGFLSLGLLVARRRRRK